MSKFGFKHPALPNTNFSRDVDVSSKIVKRGLGVFAVVWLVSVVCSIGFLGLCGYVLYHFISKAW